jgi:hypothetical protein
MTPPPRILRSFGDQGVEPGLGRGREPLRPQRLRQLVAAGEAAPVEDKVGEQEPALPARQPAVEALAVPFDHRRPAELNSQQR